MRCVYINLDRATARRAHMEAEIQAAAPAEVECIRLSAVTADQASGLPGSISATEKACFQSHLKAIREHHDGRHLLILEDDAILSPSAFQASTLGGNGWDLMFLDVSISDVRLWGAIEEASAKLAGRTRLLDLSALKFAAASAYIVNAASKERVLGAIGDGVLDAPYDILLQRLVHAGELRAVLTLPFRAAVGTHSSSSQIRPGGDVHALSDAFRRRIFDGRGDGRSSVELSAEAFRHFTSLQADRRARG